MSQLPITEKRCPREVVSQPKRWALAAVGFLCVGMGAVGAVIPGLPTTIFLIMACWCFARSCPWLEDRIRRIPLFGPFFQVIDQRGRMPVQAKLVSIGIMWIAIAGSTYLLMERGYHPALWGSVILCGFIGTIAIIRY